MKQINCNLCDKKQEKLILKKSKNKIVKCKNCGLIYINPQPSWKEIIGFYDEHYFNLEEYEHLSDGTSGYRSCVKSKKVFEGYFEKKLDFLGKRGQSKKGKLLDVGCSLGFFLDLARKRGWKPHGIEISKYAASYARKVMKLDVFWGRLKDAPYKKDCFDLVTIFQTIEHFIDPLQALKEIYCILKPGGILVITTPNIGCVYTKILGKYSFQYRHAEHLYFFNKETLSKMLSKAGFRGVLVRKDDSWDFPIEDLIERLGHFYPVLKSGLKPILSLVKKSALTKLKLRIYPGDILTVASK